jgi:hypothetical protein
VVVWRVVVRARDGWKCSGSALNTGGFELNDADLAGWRRLAPVCFFLRSRIDVGVEVEWWRRFSVDRSRSAAPTLRHGQTSALVERAARSY